MERFSPFNFFLHYITSFFGSFREGFCLGSFLLLYYTTSFFGSFRERFSPFSFLFLYYNTPFFKTFREGFCLGNFLFLYYITSFFGSFREGFCLGFFCCYIISHHFLEVSWNDFLRNFRNIIAQSLTIKPFYSIKRLFTVV
jgi:hypothetical protein